MKGDINLQEKLKAAADTEAVAAIAKEVGFSLSTDESSSTGSPHSVISRAELKNVAVGDNTRYKALHYATLTPAKPIQNG